MDGHPWGWHYVIDDEKKIEGLFCDECAVKLKAEGVETEQERRECECGAFHNLDEFVHVLGPGCTEPFGHWECLECTKVHEQECTCSSCIERMTP